MNQRRAAGSTGVAYIRWLLRARTADYMLALSVAGGSLPVCPGGGGATRR
ncbi:hypothetical protein ABLN97_19070, partial [Mycobacterium tuberculosis]